MLAVVCWALFGWKCALLVGAWRVVADDVLKLRGPDPEESPS